MTDTLICPNCSYEIEVSAALTARLGEQLRKEFEAEARGKERALAEREKSLRSAELELEQSRSSLEQELALRLSNERKRLSQEAASEARQAMSLELKDMQAQLLEARTKLDHAGETELQLRQERRRLEEEKGSLELTVARTLDQERAHIREEARNEAAEENRLKEMEKDNLVADLRRQIGELKRKSERGCPQVQGEVLELELEDLLARQFPFDRIEPVRVGTHGGDVVQDVTDSSGHVCGSILWEVKRCKGWNDNWLPKLRDDQRAARANLAVLLTTEMPRDFSTFGCIDGTWVTNRACLVGVATALRAALIEIAHTRRSIEGKQTKTELVYQYLCGSEFRQRVEGIVEAFMSMRQDLESEKRSMHRLWAKRQKQLERVVANTVGLHGDLAGIIGASLPQIANLELANAIADIETEEEQCEHPVLEDCPF
jgi:hypothetical protein